jgi:hypothetical protein
VSDIDTAVVDSLKVLDLKWPIREADIRWCGWNVRFVPQADFERIVALVLSLHSRNQSMALRSIPNRDECGVSLCQR